MPDAQKQGTGRSERLQGRRHAKSHQTRRCLESLLILPAAVSLVLMLPPWGRYDTSYVELRAQRVTEGVWLVRTEGSILGHCATDMCEIAVLGPVRAQLTDTPYGRVIHTLPDDRLCISRGRFSMQAVVVSQPGGISAHDSFRIMAGCGR